LRTSGGCAAAWELMLNGEHYNSNHRHVCKLR